MKHLTHEKKMNHQTDLDGLAAVLISVFLYVFSIMTSAEWASIMAIFAGFSAGCYNGYKFIVMIRNNRAKKKQKHNT